MSRRGVAGAVLVGAALALPAGSAWAQTLPTESGCPQDPVICQSDLPAGGVPGDVPAAETGSDSNATAYTVVGVGAALLAGGAVAARRRRSSVEL